MYSLELPPDTGCNRHHQDYEPFSLRSPEIKTFIDFPIVSMYGIFTYIYHWNQPNVGPRSPETISRMVFPIRTILYHEFYIVKFDPLHHAPSRSITVAHSFPFQVHAISNLAWDSRLSLGNKSRRYCKECQIWYYQIRKLHTKRHHKPDMLISIWKLCAYQVAWQPSI